MHNDQWSDTTTTNYPQTTNYQQTTIINYQHTVDEGIRNRCLTCRGLVTLCLATQ